MYDIKYPLNLRKEESSDDSRSQGRYLSREIRGTGRTREGRVSFRSFLYVVLNPYLILRAPDVREGGNDGGSCPSGPGGRFRPTLGTKVLIHDRTVSRWTHCRGFSGVRE